MVEHKDLVAEICEHGVVAATVGGSPYGIPTRLVREIHYSLDITPANAGPAFVRGLVNLRGQRRAQGC